MIKVNSDNVRIFGSEDMISSEIATLLRAYRDVLREKYGQQGAQELIRAIVGMSEVTEEDFEKKTVAELGDMILRRMGIGKGEGYAGERL